MIDWDALVLAPLASTFGELATYTPAGGSPFPIVGVFDEAYHELDLAGGMPVTTADPVLGVRTAQFASPPLQGDTLTIVRTVETFVVKEVRDDGHGQALLKLNLAS